MRNTWLVKNYRYSMNRAAPTVNDTPDAIPFVWIDAENDIAYDCIDNIPGRVLWWRRPPDEIITTSINSIYVVNSLFGGLSPNQTIESSSIRLATRDNEAMVFIDGLDLSKFAGIRPGFTPYELLFTDTSSKTALSYSGAVGVGESLGVNLFPDFDFTSGWSAYLSTINDSNTFTNTSTNGSVKTSSVLDYGSLYKSSLKGTADAGTIQMQALSGLPIFAYNNESGVYGTAFELGVYGSYMSIWNFSGGVGAVTDINSLTVQKVTAPPVTGIRLVSSLNGNAIGMANIDSGFNPSAVATVRITSILPLLIDSRITEATEEYRLTESDELRIIE